MIEADSHIHVIWPSGKDDTDAFQAVVDRANADGQPVWLYGGRHGSYFFSRTVDLSRHLTANEGEE